jgi:uncharacterized protein involved in exopolysaccharide biosynthesis
MADEALVGTLVGFVVGMVAVFFVSVVAGESYEATTKCLIDRSENTPREGGGMAI